ncbi:MAG: MarR family winged helix-turn-helix transcriptional regulator [Lachnospiraceae bacterium]|nr:MarR family winged helix-turn-helix transcriptional regulator [Lachnospiraceae bacterium]
MEKTLMRTVRNTWKLWAEYMKSVAAQAGIPDSYRLVLTFLLRHPGASQKELAEFRNITTASVSQIVKEMELTGYLEKRTDPKDQRYVNLYLTEKGEACAEELHRSIHLADERITQMLTPERERELIKQMEELSRIIEKELPKC